MSFTGLAPGATGVLTADVRNVGTAGAKIDAWIDFNADNVFDNNEQVVTSQTVTASGVIKFDVAVPASAKAGDLVARIRLSQLSDGQLGPGGVAQAGEVEDYLVSISSIRFDLDSSGNLHVTSLSDRRDVISVTSDATNLIFTLDQVSDVILTSSFTAAGGTLDAVGKQVKIDLAKVTGTARLNTGAGTDSISFALSNTLPKFLVDNSSTILNNTSDRLTFTSTAALNAAAITFTSADAGSVTITPSAGTAQPIEFSGGAQVDWQVATSGLTVASTSARTTRLEAPNRGQRGQLRSLRSRSIAGRFQATD